jgi:23S rRNA pseudouridine955/2504/2580 synthase
MFSERNLCFFHTMNKLTISEEQAGQRIDNFLFSYLKSIPRSRIYSMIRKGELRINGRRVKPLYKLKIGDNVRLPPLSNAQNSEKMRPRTPGSKLTQLLLASIIFEDQRIIVINKPAGIASHGGSGISFGVIEILRHAREDLKSLSLVHRLDRDTSGCLMLAKRRSALRELHRLMVAGKIIKKYLLVVRGEWLGRERLVDLPLSKNHLQSGERMVLVDHVDGKEALTLFRPVTISPTLSLLEAELKTGRTHQIRVHAAQLGCPIAGDQKYGDSQFNEQLKRQGINRLMLHAHSVGFVWENGEMANFVAPCPTALSSLPGLTGQSNS